VLLLISLHELKTGDKKNREIKEMKKLKNLVPTLAIRGLNINKNNILKYYSSRKLDK